MEQRKKTSKKVKTNKEILRGERKNERIKKERKEKKGKERYQRNSKISPDFPQH